MESGLFPHPGLLAASHVPLLSPTLSHTSPVARVTPSGPCAARVDPFSFAAIYRGNKALRQRKRVEDQLVTFLAAFSFLLGKKKNNRNEALGPGWLVDRLSTFHINMEQSKLVFLF